MFLFRFLKIFFFTRKNLLIVFLIFGLFETRIMANENGVKNYKTCLDSGNYYLGLKKYDKAEEQYQKAIEADSSLSPAYVGLGLALANLGKKEEAISNYKKALKLDPKNSLAYFSWGNLLGQLKQYKEASEKYKTAVELDNPGDPDLYIDYFEWAQALMLNGEYKNASIVSKIGISLNPNFEPSHVLLALVYRNLNENDQSIYECQKAVELN